MPSKQDYVETLASATQTRSKLVELLAAVKVYGGEQYVIAAFDASLYIVKDGDKYWARFLTTDGLLIYKDKALADSRCNYFKQVFKDAVVVAHVDALQKQLAAQDDLLRLLEVHIQGMQS